MRDTDVGMIGTVVIEITMIVRWVEIMGGTGIGTGIATTIVIGGITMIVIVGSIGVGDLTPALVQGVPMIAREANVMTIGDTETPIDLLRRGELITRAIADMIEYPSE